VNPALAFPMSRSAANSDCENAGVDASSEKRNHRARSSNRSANLQSAKRYAESGSGDLKQLQGLSNRYRLRVGDWRVIFAQEESGALRILRVAHRSNIYR
jgi:mRNA interferase RelE/StbE